MARYIERGLEKRHEQDQRMLIRDTRTLGMRVSDFFSDSFNAAIVMGALCVAIIVFPMFGDITVLVGIGVFIYARTRKSHLPFRMPQISRRTDYNDPYPGGGDNYRQARGIAFFGNDRRTNEELWFANDDLRTHVLIFGSTGSGKTEALLSISYNALIHGSGFIYVDGKGDNSLFAKVFSMCRRMGREDDVLLVNFMTGAKDVIGAQERRLSNTLNPFATGSSSMLAQLVTSLMPGSSGSGDGDMWKGRAITFVEALMKVLVYMRDNNYILLDANVIRNYFHLPRLEAIVIDKQFPRDDQDAVSLETVPDLILEPIKNYVYNLPGYDPNKKGRQVSQVLEQHGFITMQLTRVFGSLADTYGHILRTNLAEVDVADVVLNRRILVVLLPALEKAPDELANLGKIIIATLKAMMSSGLGSGVEGTFTELIQRKPTNSPTPFLCILDEYGYYAVEGFAVVPAQARSLGFSTIFAGQDLPAFQKASKEEAASIGANTNIKICMKLEDPVETWDFFNKTAGESYVTKVDAFQTNPNSITNTYMDTKSSSAEKRARIELLDLKEQSEGESHIFFRSTIVRARMFFADPKPVKFMRLIHHLRIESPPDRMLLELEHRGSRFAKAVEEFAVSPQIDGSDEEIEAFVTKLREAEGKNPIEKSVAILLSAHEESAIPEEVEEVDDLPFDQMNVFVPLRLSDPTVPMMVGEDFETFAEPLIRRNDTKNRMEYIERLTGKSTKHAANIAGEIIRDIQLATHYPPYIFEKPTGAEMASSITELIGYIKQRGEEEGSMGGTGGLPDFDEL